jgi:hypothetical protein
MLIYKDNIIECESVLFIYITKIIRYNELLKIKTWLLVLGLGIWAIYVILICCYYYFIFGPF